MVSIGEQSSNQDSRRRRVKFVVLSLTFATFVVFLSVLWITFAFILVSSSDTPGAATDGNGAAADGTIHRTKKGDGAPTFIRRSLRSETHDVTPLMSKLTLDNEEPFLKASYKRCLPGVDDSRGEMNPTTKNSRECLQHISGEGRQRIGILSPPGAVSDAFATWLEGGIRAAYDVSDGAGKTITLKGAKVDLIRSHRVPVYGYGKSHGWTKILRIVTLPVVLGAYDESSMSFHPDFSSSVEEQRGGDGDASLLLRQVVRWQCRLSHVSAHTAMLTVTSTEALEDPAGTLDRVFAFLKQDPNLKGIETRGIMTEVQDGYGNVVDESEDAVRRRAEVERWHNAAIRYAKSENEQEGSFASAAQDAAARLGSLPTWDGIKTKMEEALAVEMKHSKGMTIWPCTSFWEGLPAAGRDGATGDVPRKRASFMVPDCNAEFVKCTVKRDKCEIKGDPICK